MPIPRTVKSNGSRSNIGSPISPIHIGAPRYRFLSRGRNEKGSAYNPGRRLLIQSWQCRRRGRVVGGRSEGGRGFCLPSVTMRTLYPLYTPENSTSCQVQKGSSLHVSSIPNPLCLSLFPSIALLFKLDCLSRVISFALCFYLPSRTRFSFDPTKPIRPPTRTPFAKPRRVPLLSRSRSSV